MAISITRYVDIVSSVGAGTTVPRRNLKGRIFTQNVLVPTNSFLTFTSAADVGAWFGTTSEEYFRAVYYFGWISKNGNRPRALDFARWNDVDTAPTIYGNTKAYLDGAYIPQVAALYAGISNGSLGLTMGGFTFNLSNLDFTTVVTLDDVATVVETAINAQAGGTLWTAATVIYDSLRGAFVVTGGNTTSNPAPILATDGVGGTPVGNLLGLSIGAYLINSDGADAQSAVESFVASASANNNFGSFLYIDTLADSDVVSIATQNQTYNVMFMFLLGAIDQTAAETAVANIGAISGTGITLAPITTEYPEQFPMMILAATDYTATNSVQNYMFQISDLEPSVSDDTTANLYDALKVNYYGVTQTAGTLLAFYQRGGMMGLSTAPTTMNVYANEIWLKDAMQSALMTLLLSQARISANAQGQSQVLAVLQSVIEEATNNGTISANKTLTPSQISFINSTTGDDTAWYQVQTIGYWVNCEIVPYVVGPDTLYKAVYTLIYSKDDVINLITGEQVLI